MNLAELAKLAKGMREAHRRYFRNPTQQNLNYSKDWERKLDTAIEEVLHQPGLFDEKIKEQP